MEVSVTGNVLVATALTIASCLLIPRCICCRNAERICTASAIAMVKIIVGADIDNGVSSTPVQPPKPIPKMVDKIMIKSPDTIARIERIMINITIIITKYIAGIRVSESCIPTSLNAEDNIEAPVSFTSIFGYFILILSRISRAIAAALRTSSAILLSTCKIEFTIVAPPSGAVINLCNSGSFSAMLFSRRI